MVRFGDEITIDAFNVIPCDCYVVSGKSHVNEAVITGEPLPKIKEEGDLLLAGSRNGPSQLQARVNQDYQGSFIAQLIRSVDSSLSMKVSVQHRIDVITQYFVSGIFAIAIPTAAYTFTKAIGVNINYVDAIDIAGQKLMTILSAACPCALGLATPCAVMAGIGKHSPELSLRIKRPVSLTTDQTYHGVVASSCSREERRWNAFVPLPISSWTKPEH